MDSKEASQQIKITFPQGVVDVVEFLGEVTVELHVEFLKDILVFLKNPSGPGYEVLMDLTGVDYLFPEKRTKIVYFLHNPANLSRIRLIIYAKRGETIPTVCDLWEGAAWYERELFDLFGIKFADHQNLKRILLPDDWVGHPLRRDYKLTEESVEFKHGVLPKIPSEIIPHV